MKKLSIILIFVIVSALLLSACAETAPEVVQDETESEEVVAEKEPEVIKIGNLQDESGPMAALSGAVTLAAEMKIEEVNAAGGVNGRMIELITHDTRGDVNEAINALTRMVVQDKVQVVLGPPVSNIGIAIAPISEELQVPIVGLFMEDRCTIREEGTPWSYMFLAQNSAARQGQSIAAFSVQELGLTKFATLVNTANSYSVGLAEPFKELVKANGGEVVAEETYNWEDKDFRAQLTNIKGTDAEALFFPGYPPEIPLILAQAYELGLDIVMLGNNSVPPTGFAPTTDPAATANCYYPYGINSSDPSVTDWAAKYEERWDTAPLAQSFSGDDAIGIILQAIEACGDDVTSVCITDKLNTMGEYEGLQGTFALDPTTHQPIGLPMAIFTIEDGAPVFIEWYNPDGPAN